MLLAPLLLGAIGSPPELTGRVVDLVTAEPIVGALVATASRMTAVTDEEGRFRFGSAGVGRDTLTVTADGYRPVRFLLGADSTLRDDVRIGMLLERRAGSDPQQVAPVKEAVRTVQAAAGGALWAFEDFWPYLPYTQDPIELLVFSGLADGYEEGRCIRLAGATTCADLWIDGSAGGEERLDARFPGEIEAFLVFGPGTRASGAGFATAPRGGVVMIFFAEPGP